MESETMICYVTFLLLVKFMIPTSGRNIRQPRSILVSRGGVSWNNHFGKQFGSFCFVLVWFGCFLQITAYSTPILQERNTYESSHYKAQGQVVSRSTARASAKRMKGRTEAVLGIILLIPSFVQLIITEGLFCSPIVWRANLSRLESVLTFWGVMILCESRICSFSL